MRTIKGWKEQGKDEYRFKDEVARAQNKIVENKIDTERKRIDNLLTNGTAQTAEIGKTILVTSSGGTSVTMNYLAADIVYDKMFNNVVSKDANFVSIPYPQQGYVAKLLKPGLYNMKFVVNVKRTSGLPEIPMRIMLNSSNSLDGNFKTIKTEYLVFPATNSTSLFRNVEFLFAINEPTYIKLLITNICDASGSFNFAASDCQITAIDWEGKLCGSMPEVVDARIGEDGTKYNSLGDALRMQIKEIESRIDLTGAPCNLLKKSYAINEGGGITARMNGHDYSITGKGTDYSDVVITGERLDDSNLEAGGIYYVYGYPDGMFVAIKTEAGAVQNVEIDKKHRLALPEDAVSFRFVMHTFTDTTYNYSGTLYVYDEPVENTLQSQIYDLNEKIDAMQEIITKIVTSPQLIATENGGLQIKYSSNSEEG